MQKNIIYVGGLIAVCFIFVLFYLQSVYISWQSEILEMQSETKKILASEITLRNFSDNETELSEENLISAREFLPLESEQEKFTDEIYRSANRYNIKINSVQVDELSEVEKNFYRQAVKVQFDADYISVLNFLREISDDKRFSVLENISVNNNICDAEFFIYSTDSR